MAAPYWINALSTFAVIGALIWWRPPEPLAQSLPAERFVNAIRSGLRYARYNPDLRATLIRAAGFFPLASVYWALLPLLVRARIRGGPETYGILLGAIGVGAVCGAFALPTAAKLGADRVVAGATAGTALALVLFAIAREPATALVACVFAGISWVAAIATLNVSAQFALPGWVRGRGMAMFATVQFAGLAVGSIVWGQAAQGIGSRPFTSSRLSHWSPRSRYCGGGGFRPPPVSILRRRCIGPLRCSRTTSSPTEVRC